MSSPLTHKRTSSSPTPHHPTPLHHNSQPKPPLTQPHHSTKPNLTTTLYHTQDSVFAVTWARTLFSRSLYIHLLPNTTNINPTDDETTTSDSTSTPLFHLQVKPFIFWNKHGSKKIPLPTNQNQFVYIYYDLSRAKFGSGPEPISGFYITAIISGQIALLIGDSPKQTYSKAKSTNPNKTTQITILRREHVYGIWNKRYITKATFRGKTRDITIDCTRIAGGDDSRLCFSVDNKKILVVKHLNWKFRGNERVEMDGVHIQISWDVYNWLFEEEEEENDDGYALFMFRFEKSGFDYHEDDKYLARLNASGTSLVGFRSGFGKRKMKKGMLRTGAGSSSSSSLSSMSSGCGSVMEWESVEENELKGPTGFSLLVYAWKS